MSASPCKYCGEWVEWVETNTGKRIPLNPDGSRHHRTCRAFHRAKAETARQDRAARVAYGVVRETLASENPNQLQFGF